MKTLHKISAGLLALLLLVSTSSFAVNLHFCGEHFSGVSFGETEMVCGMETMQVAANSTCDLHKSDCCHTKKLVANGQDKFQQAKKSVVPHQQVFVAAFIITYVNLFQNQSKRVVPFKNYSPPLLVKDIQVLDETYLI